MKKGDIRSFGVDAIVASDNSEGKMIGHVADAIVRSGGQEIEIESIDRTTSRLGTAWSTGAGALPHKYIIHMAAIHLDGTTQASTIRDAVLSSLQEAERLKIRSMAYPAVGTGASQFPVEESGKAIGEALGQYFGSNPSVIEEIALVVFGEEPFPPFVSGVKAGVEAANRRRKIESKISGA